MSTKPILSLISLLLIALLLSCSDNKSEMNVPHDPSKPIEIAYFTPDSGRIAEKLIIKGSNFGNDKSIVNVSFITDEGKEAEGTVIGVDNSTIYCIVPRQDDGLHEIALTVGDKTITSDKKFRYSVSENLSTIAGNWKESGHKDGSLSEARFSNMYGIVAVDDDAVLVSQAWNGSGMRYVSVSDNKVITVQNGVGIGKMTITKDKSKVYGVGIVAPHVIYVYERAAAWAPRRVGELGRSLSKGDVWACALDKTEEWLYYLNTNGDFRRVKITDTSENELLTENLVSGNGVFKFIVYSEVDDCFYVNEMNSNVIKRVSPDGRDVVQLNDVQNPGNSDGYLTDAKFEDMLGMTVDEEGNLYVAQAASNVIRKISFHNNFVSTPIGNGESGCDDGDPKVATLSLPADVYSDGQGNFWICTCWDPVIRKYAIE